MTPIEASDLIEAITYKPNSRMTVISCTPEFLSVQLRLEVPDAYDPEHKPTTIMSTLTLGADDLRYGGEPWLLQQVRIQWHSLETHEADEWLKVRGKRVNRPHHRSRRESSR